jgi:hypothetical protein
MSILLWLRQKIASWLNMPNCICQENCPDLQESESDMNINMNLRHLVNEANAERIRLSLSDLPIRYDYADQVQRENIVHALNIFCDIADEASGQRFFTSREESLMTVLRDIQKRVIQLAITSQADYDALQAATAASVGKLLEANQNLINVAQQARAQVASLISAIGSNRIVDLTEEGQKEQALAAQIDASTTATNAAQADLSAALSAANAPSTGTASTSSTSSTDPTTGTASTTTTTTTDGSGNIGG